MAVKDYNTNADLNTTISGINIAEGCPPSGINNAIRQLMADVKEEQEAKEAQAEAQAIRDAAQDAAISAAQNAANASLISTVIEDGELVLTYGNGTVKRESLPGGLPLGTPMPYTGKDVPAGFLRADGSTYTNMQAAFPEFYTWVKNSGLTVALADYALVEGSCGFYGIDESTGTVRMPTLAAGVFGTVEAGKYGQAVQAGLPGLTGSFTFDRVEKVSGAQGAFTSTRRTDIGSNSYSFPAGTQVGHTIGFDASLSNPIYGNSDTVQPSHVKYPWVISVYNAAVAPSVAQAGEFIGLLDGKADVNLGNVTDEGKAAAVSWGMPDYSAGIAVGRDINFTAPSSGFWLLSCEVGKSANVNVYINDVLRTVFTYSSAAFNSGATSFLVAKGDVLKFTGGASGYYIHSDFYPLKGA